MQSDRKLKNLILYLSRRSENDPNFGSTKLNKLIFFCDLAAYRQLGRTITDRKYQKLERGPALRAFVPVVTEMLSQGLCARAVRNAGGFEQHRILALVEPSLEDFTAAEVKIIEDVLDENWPLSAIAISAKSHEFIGWKIVGEGEEIPMETALVSEEPPPMEALEFAKNVIPTYKR